MNKNEGKRMRLWLCILAIGSACSTHSRLEEAPLVGEERMGLRQAWSLERKARDHSGRRLASEPKLPGKSGGEILEGMVYESVPVLKYIPLVWPFADSLALGKIKSFVQELPAKESVKKAVIERIEKKSFEDDVIPFVFMLKDHYISPEGEFSAWTFRKWLESQKDQYPGFSLDPYAKKEEKKSPPQGKVQEEDKKAGLDPRVAASILEIYYELFISKDYDIDKPYYEDREVVAKVETKVSELVDILGKGYQGTEGDMSKMIRSIQKDPVKREAIAITIVKFIHQQKYRHYRMFHQIVRRYKTLERFYGSNLEKLLNDKDQEAAQRLIDQLNYSQNDRRYAMQVVVDGLQGSLARALARPQDPESQKFLKQVERDYQEAKGFEISGEDSTKGPEQNVNFLSFLRQTGEAGKKPVGYMEYFANRVLNPAHGAALVRNGISTTPTISVRNIPVALTGAPMSGKGGIGLPNFHFVDRTGEIERKFEKAGLTYPKSPPIQDRAYYFYGNDALLQEDMTKVNGMKTMFERLEGRFDTFNCAAPHDRGANWAYDTVVNLLGGEKKRDLVDIACLRELFERADNERQARALRPQIIDLIQKIRRKASSLAVYTGYNFVSKVISGLMGERAELDEKIRELIRLESRGMPQFVQYYNPFPDHFAHFTGPFSDEIIAKSGEYNRLSYMLSRFEQAFVRAGVNSRTLYGMAGDHGLGSVVRYLNPELSVFKRLREDEGAWRGLMGSDKPFEIKVRKISSDEGEGPKVSNAWRPNANLSAPADPKNPDGEWVASEDNSNRDKDVIVASTAGGNFMMDFFKSHGDLKQWAQQPVYEELRRLKLRSGQTLDVIRALTGLLPNSLDYLVVRDRIPNQPKNVRITRIVANRGGKVVHAQIFTRAERVAGSFRAQRRHFYKLLGEEATGANKTDILGLDQPNPYQLPPEGEDAKFIREKTEGCLSGAREEDPDSWCDEATWRILTQHLERKDAVNQLGQLYDSDLPGTVNLFPKKSVGYNTIVAGRHAGETFHEKDSFLGFWGNPIPPHSKVIPSGVIGSLAPTLHHYLTGKSADQSEGFDYPSLLNLFRDQE